MNKENSVNDGVRAPVLRARKEVRVKLEMGFDHETSEEALMDAYISLGETLRSLKDQGFSLKKIDRASTMWPPKNIQMTLLKEES